MAAQVLSPGESSYEQALSMIFNGDAAASQPTCIMQPRNRNDVAKVIQQVRSNKCALRVRSGGHSRFCSTNGALMLDLSTHLNSIVVNGDRVRVQGGAGMGSVLERLAASELMVPAGTHATPGFGLLMMGGLGHLSRSHGLTLDCIESISGVRADGELFTLEAGGANPEQWRLLRGAALFLAVITEVTLRAQPRSELVAIRQLMPLESLEGALMLAETCTREVSCSFVLGVPPGQRQPMAMSYWVAQSQHVALLPSELLQQKRGVWQSQVAGLEELPDFNLPNLDGSLPINESMSTDRLNRPRSNIYCLSITHGQISTLVPLILRAIRSLPNPQCRVDFQHIGGAVQDEPMMSSMYRGRQAEWSIVVSAFWCPGDMAGEEAARSWADDVFDRLEPLACHVYLVERHPETKRYKRELQLAYGSDLEPLRQMKREWDPDEILPPLHGAD